MKGQYILVNEVLIFVLGIFIVYFVANSFGSIREGIDEVTTKDHMSSISDLCVMGILKAFESGENTEIIIKMPDYISVRTFRITASGNSLVVSLYNDDRINVTREIFNISASKNIKGSVVSSSRYISITNDASGIEIKRVSGG